MKSYQLKIIKEAFTQGYNDACQGPLCEQRFPRGMGSAARIAADYSSIIAAQRAARRRAIQQFNKDVYNMPPQDAIRKLRTSVGSGSDELIQNAFYYMLQQLQRGIGRTKSPLVSMIVKRMAKFVNDLLEKIREGTMTQEEALLELYDAYGQYLPRPRGETPGSGVISTGTRDFMDRVDPGSSIHRLDDYDTPEEIQRRSQADAERRAQAKPQIEREIIFPESELSPDEAEFLRRYQEFLDRFLEGGGLGGGSVGGP